MLANKPKKLVLFLGLMIGAIIPSEASNVKSYIEPIPKIVEVDDSMLKTDFFKKIMNLFKGTNPIYVSQAIDAAFKYAHPVFPKVEDILGLIAVESNFNPHVISSLKHDPAIGITQIRPKTNGLKLSEISTIDQQIAVAANMLKRNYAELGHRETALHAYNVGLYAMKGKPPIKHSPFVNRIQRKIRLFK